MRALFQEAKLFYISVIYVYFLFFYDYISF